MNQAKTRERTAKIDPSWNNILSQSNLPANILFKKSEAKRKQENFLAEFIHHPFAVQVCEKLKLNYFTYLEWMQSVPHFRTKVELIKQYRNDKVCEEALQLLLEAMKQKSGAWIAVKWLEVYAPAWKSQQSGGNIDVNVQLVSNVRPSGGNYDNSKTRPRNGIRAKMHLPPEHAKIIESAQPVGLLSPGGGE